MRLASVEFDSRKQNIFIFSLVGLSFITIFAGFFSLFSAIDYRFHAALLLACVGSLITNREPLAFLRENIRNLAKAEVVLLTVLLIVFVVILYRSSGPITNADSGAYHLPFVRWIESHAVVKGLANVHSRFGFNSQYLVLCAVYGFSFLYQETIHALNGYILFAFLCILLLAGDRYSSSQSRLLSFVRLFIAVIAANMIWGVTSLTPDFPCTAFSILAFLTFMEMRQRESSGETALSPLLIGSLTVGAVLFKISAVPTLLLNVSGFTP